MNSQRYTLYKTTTLAPAALCTLVGDESYIVVMQCDQTPKQYQEKSDGWKLSHIAPHDHALQLTLHGTIYYLYKE